MADIQIDRQHELTRDQARTAVEEAADALADQYGVRHHWDGNTLHFKGSGASGHIYVQHDHIRVSMSLGFLLKAMKGTIKKEVEKQLDRRIG